MTDGAKGRAIFISYRRDDSEGESGRLYDDLVRAYGDTSVFMDVAGIDPGLDFRKAIDDNVATCGVLLAVIGPTWATVTGHDGTRRLESPTDYVRLEIASALKRGIPVIPVLVHEAHMPALDQLPDDLKDLRYRNSVELTHARWNSDVALLIGALKSYIGSSPANPAETVHATVPVQLPAPQGTPTPAAKKKSALYPLGIVAAACLVLLVGVLAFLHFRNAPQPSPEAQPPSQQTVPPSSGASQPAPVPAPAASQAAAPQPASPSPASPSPASSVAASAKADSPQPASKSGELALVGKWKSSTEPGSVDGLDHIVIADFAGQLMVEAWGSCGEHYCKWGNAKATLKGDTAVTESWNLRNTPQERTQQRSAVLSIQPSAGGLQVTVQNTFHMPNGHTVQNFNPHEFVRVP